MSEAAMPILLAAATRWETAPLRARLGLRRQGFESWSGRVADRPVTLVKTGMGGAAAAAALARNCPPGPDSPLLLSVGFAGGLREDLRAGDLVAEQLTACPQAAAAAARLRPEVHFGRIADSDRVLREPEEKLSRGRSRGALAVDMESAAVRAFAVARGLRALALRAVLDEAGFALPAALPEGEGLAALARHAASHPRDWPRLAALWLRQRRAAAALALAVKSFLEAL
ncbi:MAG: hypothetical protein PHF00_12290 [Elusimicrobia bacterium]|nr:hypothetical protein [Elusimicrobiota bacterium]